MDLEKRQGRWARAGRAVVRWVGELDLDVLDVALVAGLLMLAVGLWLVYTPAALIVPGAILVLIGVRTYGRRN